MRPDRIEQEKKTDRNVGDREHGGVFETGAGMRNLPQVDKLEKQRRRNAHINFRDMQHACHEYICRWR